MTETELRAERDAIEHHIYDEHRRLAEIRRALADFQEESRDG